jgi:hypothetical protein
MRTEKGALEIKRQTIGQAAGLTSAMSSGKTFHPKHETLIMSVVG